MPIVTKAFSAAQKIQKMDKLAWDKLYFGIRQDIKLGIKHGFGAGSLIGDFLSGESPFDESGSQIPFKKTNYPVSKKYRRFYSDRRRCRCNFKRKPRFRY